MEKFAAIDFETANWQQTSVCSVGIVVMNRGVIEDRFYSLIHPAIFIPGVIQLFTV